VTALSPAVQRVAANWHRRANWLGADELLAEAALVAVETERSWKPELGHLENYQTSAVARRMGSYVAQMASPCPLAIGNHVHPAGQRAGLGDLDNVGEAPRAEFHIDLKRAVEEVQKILARQSPAARAVLLEEREPVDVAAELGLPASRVYTETQLARKALRKNRRLAVLAGAVL
jgi:DNA-directed RNA polymerase specialized sigma24 family protein